MFCLLLVCVVMSASRDQPSRDAQGIGYGIAETFRCDKQINKF
jgi:hypothetical protein